ncbi:replication protein [Bat circovirus]|nr:replication protein [Bat circovirus]
MAPKKKRSGPPPAKRWVFTLNNPSPKEIDHIRGQDMNMFDYLVCGEEGMGEGKTPHLQGFANFSKKKTFNQVKKIFGSRCHIEKAKGTDKDNKQYCTKEGNVVVEAGAPRSGGQRTDLSSAVSTVLESGSLRAVAESHPVQFVSYHRGLSELLKVAGKAKARDWKTSVHVIIGPPGCGKSKWACNFAEPETTFWKAPRNKWWDGYCGQEVVILDDFYGWLPYDDLLRLCDRYPLTVETKGGTVPFLASTILITSNKVPQEWYSSESVPAAEALFRRITTLQLWKTTTTPSMESEEKFVTLDPPCEEFPYEINF